MSINKNPAGHFEVQIKGMKLNKLKKYT